MATSNTYTFDPAFSETILYAYGLLGIRRTSIEQQHLADAAMAANLMLSEWASRGVNLWLVQLSTITLVAGTATYSVPTNVAMILGSYIETTTGSVPNDRVITAISRDEYAAIPNKTTQGPPTQYWFDRLLAKTVTLWPVPDNVQTYTYCYYNVTRAQDASIPGGVTNDVPYEWQRAFAVGLAAELAPAYAPDREVARRAEAERAFLIAAEWNVENTPMSISPGLSSYFR